MENRRNDSRFTLGVLAITLVLYALLAAFFLKNYYRNDGMNYVDVARNIANGDGIVQSTLGFNAIEIDRHDTIPVPFTIQPPLFPIAIAGLASIGMEELAAGILLSSIGAILTITGLYVLYRGLYDHEIGLAVALVAFVYRPLLYASIVPLTDAMGVAVSIWMLWLLRQNVKHRAPAWLMLLTGIVAGVGFGLRYILGFWLPLGIVLLWLAGLRWRWRAYIAFGVGWSVVSLPIVWRNWSLTHRLTGGSRNPSDQSLWQNMDDLLLGLLGNPFSSITPVLIAGALLVSLAIMMEYVLRQRRGRGYVANLRAKMQELFGPSQRWWPLGVALVYAAVMLVFRTISHFDHLSGRLMMLTGLLLTATFWVIMFRVLITAQRDRRLFLILLLVLGIMLRLTTLVPEDPDQFIQTDPLLAWIDQQSEPDALIVGEDSVIVSFHFRLRDTISFSPYPYTNHLTHDRLTDWVCLHGDQYAAVYIYTMDDPEEPLLYHYGQFIVDLQQGNVSPYDNLQQVTTLADERQIYEIRCGE